MIDQENLWDFGDLLEYMIAEIQKRETADAVTLATKLFEEGGELSAATLIDHGFCQHKATPDEDAIYEVADVFICALGVLVKLNSMQDIPASSIREGLHFALRKKFAKYQRKVLYPEDASPC